MTGGLTTDAEALLSSEPLVAHLATCRDGAPHVAPVWYALNDGRIEVATTGRKLANLRANPRVALSVQKADGADPVWGVSLQGPASVVADEAAGRAVIRRINRRYGEDPDAWSENTAVVIEVEDVSSWQY